MSSLSKPSSGWSQIPSVLGHALFWSWNVIFLAFMVFGFAPTVLPEMITAVRLDTIPASFFAYALILSLIPLAAFILGFYKLRWSGARLFALGYAVEAPLMLLLVIRFFLIGEANPAVLFLFGAAGVGMAAFLWQILDRRIDERNTWLAYLRVIGLSVFLAVALYASLWLAFYILPITTWGLERIGYIVQNIADFFRDFGQALRDLVIRQWYQIPFFILLFILALYTATLFVVMPIAVPLLAMRAWLRSLRNIAGLHGWIPALGLPLLALAVCGLLFVQVNRQPQDLAFDLLQDTPANAQEAQDLLDQQEQIREGLLNAYLAPVRYISSQGEVEHIQSIYEDLYNLSPDQAESVQQLYESVAQPMLYRPVERVELKPWETSNTFNREPLEAARLYQQFFDQPINVGERERVLRAVSATWSPERARAAQQAVDDREVLLAQQELRVSEHGSWAEVELYEVYQNQTGEQQEVVYYFSLPESAVVTGLWLGNSPDRDSRYVHTVAPRGAAQAVYRNEMVQRRDPALLEQIGPRQYRLRIFPIPGIRTTWDQNLERTLVEEAPALHLWMTYQVLAEGEVWPLPRLAEKRNVFWDDRTERLLDGSELTIEGDAWLPESLLAVEAVQPAPHRVDFSNGWSVLANPLSAQELPLLPDSARLAVVLDRSRSMAEYNAEVQAALKQLAGRDVDLYLSASQYRGEAPSQVRLAEFDAQGILYYGGQNAAELLAQYESLRSGQEYDAVLVLTDGSGYELGQNQVDVPVSAAPIWMVHLNGDFSIGYDDKTLETLQASGGGVAGSLDEALSRLALSLDSSAAGAEVSVDWVDGYAWIILPTQTLENAPTPALSFAGGAESIQAEVGPFAAFAARRVILAEMQHNRGDLSQLAILDQLHDLAVEHSVVTPYSSMIVLVNAQQRSLLNKLENRGDRFQREFEDVGESVPQSAFNVTGVPEPEEWLLIGLALAFILWYFRDALQKSAQTLWRTS